MTDLFQRLRVCQVQGETQAARVDAGWAAWRSRQPAAGARWHERLRFWLALYRHFGQARFLVQVDNTYHTACSVRVRQLADSGLEVLLIQTDNLLLNWLNQWRPGRRHAPAWRRSLQGEHVVLSRFPADQEASLPRLPLRDGQPVNCPEVVLDLQRPATLPLRISAH